MKMSFLILLQILTSISIVKSQNLLNYSENSVKNFMNEKGVYFDGKKYDKNGTPFLKYSYSTISAMKDGLLVSYYYLDDNGNCSNVSMGYNSMEFLDGIVSEFNSNPDLAKVPKKFVWVNHKAKYAIEVVIVDSNTFLVNFG